MNIKKYLDQPSTKKGLVVLGSAVAVAIGNPELFTVTVTESGAQLGGLIGTVVAGVMGLLEVLRDENDSK